MVSETERARELLKSVDRTLEESRNRPHVDVDWQAPSSTVAVPVEKTALEPRMNRSMDPQSSKAWNDWANGIASRQCRALSKAICDTLGKRVKQLESEVEALKQRQPAPSEEWPLRSINGGKR